MICVCVVNLQKLFFSLNNFGINAFYYANDFITSFLVVMYHVFQFWDIKCFYNTALRIPDSDLESVSWWDVQQRLLAAQTEHMMCIHKEILNSLISY